MKPGNFFSTTLSSHIVPVIFAIGVLFIAERKISGGDQTDQTAQSEQTARSEQTMQCVQTAQTMQTEQTMQKMQNMQTAQTMQFVEPIQSLEPMQSLQTKQSIRTAGTATGQTAATKTLITVTQKLPSSVSASPAKLDLSVQTASATSSSTATGISIFGTTPAIIALAGAANVQQVIAVGRVSGLIMKVIR